MSRARSKKVILECSGSIYSNLFIPDIDIFGEKVWKLYLVDHSEYMHIRSSVKDLKVCSVEGK